jgi:hypothetical protein
LDAGETVVVIAVGGVRMNLVQMARAFAAAVATVLGLMSLKPF